MCLKWLYYHKIYFYFWTEEKLKELFSLVRPSLKQMKNQSPFLKKKKILLPFLLKCRNTCICLYVCIFVCVCASRCYYRCNQQFKKSKSTDLDLAFIADGPFLQDLLFFCKFQLAFCIILSYYHIMEQRKTIS